jgi:RNA polymerase sigma factor (sigma-70 family)
MDYLEINQVAVLLPCLLKIFFHFPQGRSKLGYMSSMAGTIHADQLYLQGLADNSQSIIGEIYERFAGKVKYYIVNNSGTEEDAADIFQEALIDIYQQAKYKGLQLTCPFEAFLLLVCKRKWLNKLKKKGLYRVTTDPEQLSGAGEDVFALAEQMQQQDERARLFMTMFEKLGAKCREVIRCCLSGKPQEEIAAALGVSYGYLRKKKSACMAELIQSIRSQQNTV